MSNNKKRSGSVALISVGAALILSIMLFPAFSRTLSSIFAGAESADQAIQAQQFAIIRADIVRATNYQDVVPIARTATPFSNKYEEKVDVGAEEVIDSIKQVRSKMVTISIYKEDELTPRYVLQVPISTNASGGVPEGTIIAWHGNINDLPSGWKLCDGTNGTPDLRDKFILGAGGDYVLNSTGGEKDHTLTIAEMPRHNHPASISGSLVGDRYGNYIRLYDGNGDGYYTAGATSISNILANAYAGNDQPHNNMPPYHALYYIMKE